MKRMLINATQPEELRVALVDGQRLYDLDIEHTSREQKKANIYKGRVTRIEPSLDAAFVDFGSERHGFLPFKEISRRYFNKQSGDSDSNSRPNIKEVLGEGQELIIQVTKEERGSKGAALTTFISLAGRYLVLMPNNPRAGGISRRIEGEDRNSLKETMSHLTIPNDMGVIARTAGVGKSSDELQWDLDYLLHLWQAISKASEERSAPFLIYQESNVVIRAIRDYLRHDIDEVLIDNEKVYQEAHEFIQQVIPAYQNKVKLFKDSIPLFIRYQIESQIETAFQREVQLPSGGSIVIDPTEALVSIDINSSRATKGEDIEETALHTNLEAAEEIARQLRLRDIGGLIVIDFIDMTPYQNQREVENKLQEFLQQDRARIQTGRISRFGLMEMSRQRLRPSLGETSAMPCPRCSGQGTIRDTKSLALSVIRLVEEEALKENTAHIRAHVPIDLATYLLNEKRIVLSKVEKHHNVNVLIIPNPNLETPHFSVQRLRQDEIKNDNLSFEISEETQYSTEIAESEQATTPNRRSEAAIKSIKHSTPAPKPKKPQKREGLIQRLFKSLFKGQESPKSKNNQRNKNTNQQNKRTHHGNRPQHKQRQHNKQHPQSGRKPQNRHNQNRKNTGNQQRNTNKENTARKNETKQREQKPKNQNIKKDDRVSAKNTTNTNRKPQETGRNKSPQANNQQNNQTNKNKPQTEIKQNTNEQQPVKQTKPVTTPVTKPATAEQTVSKSAPVVKDSTEKQSTATSIPTSTASVKTTDTGRAFNDPREVKKREQGGQKNQASDSSEKNKSGRQAVPNQSE